MSEFETFEPEVDSLAFRNARADLAIASVKYVLARERNRPSAVLRQRYAELREAVDRALEVDKREMEGEL